MHANAFYIEEAFRKGADGYVVKEALELDILEAIRSVTSGQRYLSRLPKESVVVADPDFCQKQRSDPFESLTNREKEIFHLIVQGNQNKEIAKQLSISVRTVETHRAKIMDKLSLRDQAELVRFAVRRKIIKLP
jgi:DNA-binding NarL/FixJ family response regulator